MSSSDEDVRAYYEQGKSEQTISSILGTVFTQMSEGQEEVSERDQPPVVKKMHLDEETFEPVVKEGETPLVPTDEEIRKHPELEYTNEEVRQIVSQMSAEDRIQFKEFEQDFLTCIIDKLVTLGGSVKKYEP